MSNSILHFERLRLLCKQHAHCTPGTQSPQSQSASNKSHKKGKQNHQTKPSLVIVVVIAEILGHAQRSEGLPLAILLGAADRIERVPVRSPTQRTQREEQTRPERQNTATTGASADLGMRAKPMRLASRSNSV